MSGASPRKEVTRRNAASGIRYRSSNIKHFNYVETLDATDSFQLMVAEILGEKQEVRRRNSQLNTPARDHVARGLESRNER